MHAASGEPPCAHAIVQTASPQRGPVQPSSQMQLMAVSPQLLWKRGPMGLSLRSISRIVAETYILSMFSALNADGLVGLMARANLKHIQIKGKFMMNPLTVPAHPLEWQDIQLCDTRWALLRQLCTRFVISIDSPPECGLAVAGRCARRGA